MINFFSVLGKFWKIFMKKGNSAFMYGTLASIFFFFKKIFRIKILQPLLKRQHIYQFDFNSVNSSFSYEGFWSLNPIFIFFYLLEHGKPVVILSSRLVRGDIKRIPFFFNIDLRSYAKVFRWLKDVIKTKNSLFFLLHQRLLFELVLLYKNNSSVLSLKNGVHQDLLATRPNLRFLHKI